jgi:Domain of unknown function (DUF1839)
MPGLSAADYHRHMLHAEERIWVEKNCYIDIWIELLHALRLEPRAILPFAAAIDFEGDQWTFFKPPHTELYELYGIDVQELNVWRPLLEHALEHLQAGRLISTEADAFWLPDTSGTDYRRQHTKSTIVLAELDVANQRLGYFHNAGYFTLDGEDFARTFRVGAAPDPGFMPLFAETVRLERRVQRPDAELAALSRALWKKHLARAPRTNPIVRFRERFEHDLSLLHERGLGFYHAWAFATTRQLGASFELLALNLRWLAAQGALSRVEEPIAAFESIAAGSKTFILKGARVVNAKRAFDGAQLFSEMAAAWDRGMESMAERLCA